MPVLVTLETCCHECLCVQLPEGPGQHVQPQNAGQDTRKQAHPDQHHRFGAKAPLLLSSIGRRQCFASALDTVHVLAGVGDETVLALLKQSHGG